MLCICSTGSSQENNHMGTRKSPLYWCQKTSLCSFQMASKAACIFSLFIPSSGLNLWCCLKHTRKGKALSDYELKNSPHSAGIWMINEFYFKALIPLSAFCFFLCQVAITAQGRALLLTDPGTFLHFCSWQILSPNLHRGNVLCRSENHSVKISPVSGALIR